MICFGIWEILKSFTNRFLTFERRFLRKVETRRIDVVTQSHTASWTTEKCAILTSLLQKQLCLFGACIASKCEGAASTGFLLLQVQSDDLCESEVFKLQKFDHSWMCSTHWTDISHFSSLQQWKAARRPGVFASLYRFKTYTKTSDDVPMNVSYERQLRFPFFHSFSVESRSCFDGLKQQMDTMLYIKLQMMNNCVLLHNNSQWTNPQRGHQNTQKTMDRP